MKKEKVTERIHIRLTPREKLTLTRLAKQAHLSLSRFVVGFICKKV